jgi:thymidylate synthase
MNLQENIQRIKKLMGIITEEEQDDTQNKILYPLSTGGEKTIILLPGSGENGGQGYSDFNKLATNLGSDFSVYTANFPNELDVRKYVQEIVNEINNNPNIRSFAVGGFSIGGAMAWHLARILEEENVEKFNNKLFLIDSGISNSTDEFIEDMIKGNTPRVAIAQPLSVFIKNRNGENLTPDEEIQIQNFYTSEKLNIFKNKEGVKDNYIEYVGSMFPPSTEEILRTAKDSNPWIIEDKYDTTNFETRYSVKPKQIKGKTFKEGDIIDYKEFAERDTKKKIGLNRELPDGGTMGPLNGVEVISLLAGQKKEGDKTPEEIDNVKSEVNNITNNPSSRVEVINAQHNNITSSKELVNKISELF